MGGRASLIKNKHCPVSSAQILRRAVCELERRSLTICPRAGCPNRLTDRSVTGSVRSSFQDGGGGPIPRCIPRALGFAPISYFDVGVGEHGGFRYLAFSLLQPGKTQNEPLSQSCGARPQSTIASWRKWNNSFLAERTRFAPDRNRTVAACASLRVGKQTRGEVDTQPKFVSNSGTHSRALAWAFRRRSV